MKAQISIEEIIYRLKDLKPGESVIYYVGNLASQQPQMGDHRTANVALALYEEGRVHLLQRRLGPPVTYMGNVDWFAGHGPGFEYIAVGRSRPTKAPTFGAHLRSVREAV